jgi:hypothetical protein
MKITIGFKQLGQNIILTIEGEQLSKRFPEKKEREQVKAAVEAYNELPKSKQTKKDLNAIKDMMDKEKTNAPAKSSPKKESKSSDEAINFRQLGQNIILNIDGEEHTKRFSEKSDREQVKSLVAEYNDLPKSKRTKTKLKAILALMVKSTESAKPKKPSKSTASKKPKNITGKQMGQNIILVIEGEKHSKRFPDKEDRTIVLGLVQEYNKKNTQSALDKILKLMEKEEKTSAEKVKGDIDKMSKSSDAPASTKKLTKEEEIAKAKKLLEENGHQVTKKNPQPSTPSRRRGREY